jgi:cobalt-zinc-cadmium efflux system protein
MPGDENRGGQVSHIHGRSVGRRRERRGLTLAIGFSGAILLAEVGGGILTNSLALLADAGHMLVDLASLVMSLVALTFALRPASERRTYGLHRLEILAALANGVTLILICLYIFHEAYQRFLAPEPVRSPQMLVIAFVGLVANGAAILALREGESLNVRSAFLHVLGDTLSSVGIIVGGAVMLFTGWYVVDPIISVLIALLILVSAYRVTMEAVNILLEATPRDIDLREVIETVRGVEGVLDIHDVHIWSITSGLHALSAHLLVEDQALSRCGLIVGQVEHILAEGFGIAHTTLQCECGSCGREGMICDLAERGGNL